MRSTITAMILAAGCFCYQASLAHDPGEATDNSLIMSCAPEDMKGNWRVYQDSESDHQPANFGKRVRFKHIQKLPSGFDEFEVKGPALGNPVGNFLGRCNGGNYTLAGHVKLASNDYTVLVSRHAEPAGKEDVVCDAEFDGTSDKKEKKLCRYLSGIDYEKFISVSFTAGSTPLEELLAGPAIANPGPHAHGGTSGE